MDPISILLITFLSLGILTAVGGLIFTAFDFAKPKGGNGDKITSNIRTKASPFKEINKEEDIKPALNGMVDFYTQEARNLVTPFHKEEKAFNQIMELIKLISHLHPNQAPNLTTQIKPVAPGQAPNLTTHHKTRIK